MLKTSKDIDATMVMVRPNFLTTCLVLLILTVMMSACAPTGSQFNSDFSRNPGLGDFNQDPNTQTLSPANGRILGKGPVRVALLLPQSAQGFGALAAENFANGADLALREFGEDVINVVIKDTGGSAQKASEAASEALSEGADVFLGPVFSNNVPSVSAVARPAGVPIISFSNASGLASRGVYIFGFSPEPGIKRAIQFAGAKGSRSYAALLPNNTFGTLAEAAFRQSVTTANGRIVTIQRYKYDGTDPQTKAQQIGALAASGQIDTVFIPDAGDIAPDIVKALKQAIPAGRDIRLIGSGQWDDPRIFRNPVFKDAYYAAPDRTGFNEFAKRYNAAFGKPPIRLASLAYDATSLMIVLAQNFPADKFSQSRLTAASGFRGTADGTFRILPSGKIERALAVYMVTDNGPEIASPAPSSFDSAANNDNSLPQ